MNLEALEKLHDIVIDFRRHRLSADDPTVEIRVAVFQQGRVSVKLFRSERAEMRIGEPAEDQVHFPGTAVPASIAQPFPARSERVFLIGTAVMFPEHRNRI